MELFIWKSRSLVNEGNPVFYRALSADGYCTIGFSIEEIIGKFNRFGYFFKDEEVRLMTLKDPVKYFECLAYMEEQVIFLGVEKKSLFVELLAKESLGML